MDILSYFSNPFALVPLVMIVGGFINTKIGLKGTAAQAVIAASALALAFLGNWLELGFFGTQDLLWTGIYGVAAALSSMGIASNDFIKMILELVKLKVPKKN